MYIEKACENHNLLDEEKADTSKTIAKNQKLSEENATMRNTERKKLLSNYSTINYIKLVEYVYVTNRRYVGTDSKIIT